jgi:hypothetical protein
VCPGLLCRTSSGPEAWRRRCGTRPSALNYDWSFADFEIQPGPASEAIRGRTKEFLEEIWPKLDSLVADFGRFNAKELELRSTIVYLFAPGQARTDLINRVHEVKPHFSHAQI